MPEKKLIRLMQEAAARGRRLVAPLVGFPGLALTGGTIKLAQQNIGEHFRALKAIADAFTPDVIFPMMDLSVEANALGRYTVFPKEESATVVKDVFHAEEMERAKKINISYDTRLLGYVETLKLAAIGLPQPILKGAYVTGPYTLAGLLLGADEAALATVMDSRGLHDVCRFTTEKILEYARLLVASGAEILCVLEPSAVMLGPDQFEEFSGNYVRDICRSLEYTDAAVVYHTCGNSMHLIEKMCAAGVNGLSLDAPETGVDLADAARRAPEDVAVIGNISPVGTLLHGTAPEVEKEVADLLETMAPFPHFILSTGCDLPQETPVDNIKAFMRAGRRVAAQGRS
jgi:uroporphyrinogen decarboxylase